MYQPYHHPPPSPQQYLPPASPAGTTTTTTAATGTAAATAPEYNPLVEGGAMPHAEFHAVFRRWRKDRDQYRALLADVAQLRETMRKNEALLRGFLDARNVTEVPLFRRRTAASDPKVPIGELRIKNLRPVPKPITKGHLENLLEDYDRIDEVTREHLKNYIWTHREFSPATVVLDFIDAEEEGNDEE